MATTDLAFDYCLRRFGAWEPVITWAEFKAWGAAAEKATDEQRTTIMREGLAYFQSRMARVR